MKFNSQIVKFANMLMAMRGLSRSLAYKAAFKRYSPTFLAFEAAMKAGKTVTVYYRADKHEGEVQGRVCIPMGVAIEKGLYTPTGTGASYPHLFPYFDMEKGEVRKFKFWNFVGFRI